MDHIDLKASCLVFTVEAGAQDVGLSGFQMLADEEITIAVAIVITGQFIPVRVEQIAIGIRVILGLTVEDIGTAGAGGKSKVCVAALFGNISKLRDIQLDHRLIVAVDTFTVLDRVLGGQHLFLGIVAHRTVDTHESVLDAGAFLDHGGYQSIRGMGHGDLILLGSAAVIPGSQDVGMIGFQVIGEAKIIAIHIALVVVIQMVHIPIVKVCFCICGVPLHMAGKPIGAGLRGRKGNIEQRAVFRCLHHHSFVQHQSGPLRFYGAFHHTFQIRRSRPVGRNGFCLRREHIGGDHADDHAERQQHG